MGSRRPQTSGDPLRSYGKQKNVLARCFDVFRIYALNLEILIAFCHDITPMRLLGFLMNGVLLAGRTILLEFETIGIVPLILEAIVVSVLALGALKRHLESRGFDSHCV